MTFEKDCVYYRGDVVYNCGVDISAYLGDNNVFPDKLALSIFNFINDKDAKTLEIVKHEAKAGDDLAHVSGIVLKLERKPNGEIVATK